MPTHRKRSRSSAGKAVVLLSAAGLGGLCAASLAPLADSTAAASHGPAAGVNDAVRRQDVWSQERQQHYHQEERPLQNSRRRQRPSSSSTRRQKNKAAAAAAADPSENGMFNSFSLAEHEPSSYYSSMNLVPRETNPPPPPPRGHHEPRGGAHDRRVPAPPHPYGGGYYYYDDDAAFAESNDEHESYDISTNNNGGDSADEQQLLLSRRLLSEDDAAEFDAASHYYRGRGRNAAQTLARNQDFGRGFYNAPAPSAYRHRHQLSFFAGGNPYSSSSGSGSRAGAARHGRRRARGGLAASPFPTFSPAVAAAASAAAGVLVKTTAAAGLALAVLAPLAAALSSHWAYFAAGGICAAISHTAAVPLDVIKTRIQCAPAGVEYRGTWDAIVRICRSEGGRVLFCGAGATLVGYALQGSLKFGFFEFLKPVFSGLFGRYRGGGGTAAAAAAAAAASTPVLGVLIAASVTAEIVGSTALTPLEAARIRMVADADYAPGLRSGIARMIAEEGLGSLTRGLPAVLAKQVPYTVTKLVTFDYLVRSVASRFGSGAAAGGGGGGKGGVGAGVGVTVACAVIAGVLSSLASQPGDSLLSALNSEGRGSGNKSVGGTAAAAAAAAAADMTDSGSSEEAEGACSSEDQDTGGSDLAFNLGGAPGGGVVTPEELEPVTRAMRRIVGEIGLLGLFRGMGARMMHVTSIVTVQLLIYQSIKRMVGIET